MMKYPTILLMFCFVAFVLTGCGEAVEQIVEQVLDQAETLLNDSEESETEPEAAVGEADESEKEPAFEPEETEKIAQLLEEQKVLKKGTFIDPGDNFIPAVAWVMGETGIWSGDEFIPVVALILLEIEEAFDDCFVYKDGRIYLEKNLVEPNDTFIPTIERILKEIDPGDYFDPTKSDILRSFNVNPRDLFEPGAAEPLPAAVPDDQEREQIIAKAIYPFRDRFIDPGDKADGKPTPETIDALSNFIPAVAWVMGETGIWPSDDFIPVVALILLEIEEAFDDRFAYKDGRIYLEKNLVEPNDTFLPAIEKMVREVSAQYGGKITPADYEKIYQEGGILKQYSINPKELFQ